MKNKFTFLALVLGLVFCGISVSAVGKESKEARLVREAKITMAQARQTALARVPGTIEMAQLEREKGKVLFEFEIHKADNNAEVEIHVDAVSGEIFETKEEKGGGSAKEKAMFDQIKVSMDSAEQTALNKVSGAVVKVEIERERGKLLYEFEIITSDGKEEMVHVDVVSGEIESVGKK